MVKVEVMLKSPQARCSGRMVKTNDWGKPNRRGAKTFRQLG
jgi:hypothetical protein